MQARGLRLPPSSVCISFVPLRAPHSRCTYSDSQIAPSFLRALFCSSLLPCEIGLQSSVQARGLHLPRRSLCTEVVRESLADFMLRHTEAVQVKLTHAERRIERGR